LHSIARKNSDSVHAHLPGTMSEHVVAVFQLNFEHGVWQWLDHRSFENDGIFLGLWQVRSSIII
jgi:hypothetical protein